MVYKGKGHPRTGHKGLGGELRYSSTLSLTSALDGGRWSMLYPAMQIQYIAHQLVNMVYTNQYFFFVTDELNNLRIFTD
jgi:hypothetical protein